MFLWGSLSMGWPMGKILGGAFPCQKPQNGEKKGAFVDGNDAKAKNSVKPSLSVERPTPTTFGWRSSCQPPRIIVGTSFMHPKSLIEGGKKVNLFTGMCQG